MSEFSYDADGSLVRYWTDEISDKERSSVDDWGASRFEIDSFRLPNPFELGDIVSMADDPDSLGIVETSREGLGEMDAVGAEAKASAGLLRLFYPGGILDGTGNLYP